MKYLSLFPDEEKSVGVIPYDLFILSEGRSLRNRS